MDFVVLYLLMHFGFYKQSKRKKKSCCVMDWKVERAYMSQKVQMVEKELGGGGSGLQHGPRLGLGGLHGKPERSVSSSSSDDVDVEVEVGVGG